MGNRGKLLEKYMKTLSCNRIRNEEGFLSRLLKAKLSFNEGYRILR